MMKRKALLIGDTIGCVGVAKDLANWRKFLMSEVGGCWLNSEIEIIQNSTRDDILQRVSEIRSKNYDFSIVVFSGHGGTVKSTVLWLNDKEYLLEAELKRISSRQITVLDCCRVHEKIADAVMERETFSKSWAFSDELRAKYDRRQMSVIPHGVTLYACSDEECAYTTSNGGYYTNNLLKSAMNIDSKSDFISVIEAHNRAKYLTYQEVLSREGHNQTPDISMPRLSTTFAISINPMYSTIL